MNFRDFLLFYFSYCVPIIDMFFETSSIQCMTETTTKKVVDKRKKKFGKNFGIFFFGFGHEKNRVR